MAYRFFPNLLFLLLGLTPQTSDASTQQNFTSPPSKNDWTALQNAVGGRLIQGAPFAEPCFTGAFNSSACLVIQSGYLDEGISLAFISCGAFKWMIFLATISSSPGGYLQSQWGTCQVTGDECLLSDVNPHDITPTLPPSRCKIGSVPEYFVCLHFVFFCVA